MFDVPAVNPQPTNFAPLEPLTLLQTNGQEPRRSSFASMIRTVFSDLRMRNLQERREINEQARLMASLRSGKLIMMQDPVYGHLTLLKPLPQTTNSHRHVHPLAQVNSTQLTSIWSLSRSTTVPRDFGNTNQSKIVQATLEQIIQHYDSSQMDEKFHQEESLSAMDYGTIAIRVQYDERLNQIRKIAPIVQDQTTVAHEGYGYCKTCGKDGVPGDFQADGELGAPRCKACGSYNVGDIVPARSITAPQIVGSQEIVQGDIAIDLVPIGSLNWDMRYFIQDSSWVYQQTEVASNYVKSLLQVPINDADPSFDDGLRVINATGTRGGSVRGWGRDNLAGNYEMLPNTTIMHELWLKPEFYANWRAEADEKTVGGQMIRKDQLYTDVFRDGIAAVGFNDMNILVGAFNEKCRISSTVYHIQSNSGVGKGTTDSIEVSEHLNVAHSAAMALIKKFAAGGGWWYDTDVMNEKQAKELLKPGGLVGVKMRGTNYTSVDQALRKVEVGALDNGNINMIAQLSNMLNIVFQTTDFTSGVADSRVDINTLGGQQLLQAQNQQRSAAPLRMKAFLRTKVFENVLELFRQHIIFPKFIGSRDKFSLTKGKFVSGADLPEKVFCDSVPDSELPVNRLTRRDNLERMLQQTGQSGMNFFDLKQTDPRFASWLAGEFHVEMPIFNYTEILIVCQNRLDQILELASEEEKILEMSGFSADPKMVAESLVDQILPPVQATEDNLVIKAQVLAEYLDDEASTQWTPLQSAAVTALIWRHYRSDRDMRGGLMALEQETQLGLQQRAVEQEMANAQKQGQMQSEQDLTSAIGEIVGQSVSEEDAYDRENEKADKNAERDEKKAQADHKRSAEIEKLRGKTKPQK